MKTSAIFICFTVAGTFVAVADESVGSYFGRTLLSDTSVKHRTAHIVWAMLAILGLGALMGCIIFCFWCFSTYENKMDERDQSVYERAYTRLKNHQAFFSLPSLVTGRYYAEYSEFGSKKDASYFLEFDDAGKVEGSVIRNKDFRNGLFEVRGQFNADKRAYEWAESKPGAAYRDVSDPESCHSTLMKDKPFHIEVVVKVVRETAGVLEGRYYSSFGTRGPIRIGHMQGPPGTCSVRCAPIYEEIMDSPRLGVSPFSKPNWPPRNPTWLLPPPPIGNSPFATPSRNPFLNDY